MVMLLMRYPVSSYEEKVDLSTLSRVWMMRQPNEVAWRLMEPNWLNRREDRAWRAFQHAHHQLDVHLNRGLQESGLSGADYEVLAVLSAHDGTACRPATYAMHWAGRKAVSPTRCGVWRRTG
jgi:hypothetical protein